MGIKVDYRFRWQWESLKINLIKISQNACDFVQKMDQKASARKKRVRHTRCNLLRRDMSKFVDSMTFWFRCTQLPFFCTRLPFFLHTVNILARTRSPYQHANGQHFGTHTVNKASCTGVYKHIFQSIVHATDCKTLTVLVCSTFHIYCFIWPMISLHAFYRPCIDWQALFLLEGSEAQPKSARPEAKPH